MAEHLLGFQLFLMEYEDNFLDDQIMHLVKFIGNENR